MVLKIHEVVDLYELMVTWLLNVEYKDDLTRKDTLHFEKDTPSVWFHPFQSG